MAERYLRRLLPAPGRRFLEIAEAFDLGRRHEGEGAVGHEIVGPVPYGLAQTLLNHSPARRPRRKLFELLRAEIKRRQPAQRAARSDLLDWSRRGQLQLGEAVQRCAISIKEAVGAACDAQSDASSVAADVEPLIAVTIQFLAKIGKLDLHLSHRRQPIGARQDHQLPL